MNQQKPRRSLRRLGRAAVFGFRGVTARVHRPLFWRALYGLLERRFVIQTAATTAQATAPRLGTDARGLMDRALPIFLTGWPHHDGTPWVNLNVSRFHRRVVRELGGEAPRPQRASRAEAGAGLRVGVLARLEKAFFFSGSFFAAVPEGVEVVAFDLGSRSDVARDFAGGGGYGRFSLSELDAVAAAIVAADLDLLLVDVKKDAIYDVLDRIDTPCVAILCAEVYVRWHPAVSFHLYPFQQADYLLRNGRLFCATSGTWLGDEAIYPGFLPYDRHGIDIGARRLWRDRENFVFLHGRLFKASDAYLACVFGLLHEDPALELVLMGSDQRGALARITAAAAASGLEGRVHYEGPYTSARDAGGELADPSWERLFDLLGRTRLAPDPWPFAAGATRLEAYAAGAPSVHMGIRTDPAAWGRAQDMLTFDHFALEIPAGTAYDTGSYQDLCRRALYDPSFADSLAAEQAQLALRLSDPGAFWRQLLDCYALWRRTSGVTGNSRTDDEL